MRVFELADELQVRSIDVLDACEDVGLAGVEAGTDLTEDQVKRVRFAFNQREVAAAMTSSVAVERSSAPVLTPIVDPTRPPFAPPPGAVPPPGMVPAQGLGPPPGHPRVQATKGMHPLVKQSIWYFVLGQIVPCIGIYFLVSSVILAGKGRRQIAWSGGRYSGDTAGLVIQILFWAELAFSVVMIAVFVALGGTSTR